MMQVSAVPSRLHCRDEKKEVVLNFVRRGMERHKTVHAGAGMRFGGSLYVTGTPGTGKTATVRECITTLKQEGGPAAAFKYIEMNSMRLPTAKHAYSFLWRALFNEQLGPDQALIKLEDHFAEMGKLKAERLREIPLCVLLADELDWLMMQKQTAVMYNLLNWSMQPGFVVIGIANTLDLPDRLSSRNNSRVGLEHLVFESYKTAQIEVGDP